MIDDKDKEGGEEKSEEDKDKQARRKDMILMGGLKSGQ